MKSQSSNIIVFQDAKSPFWFCQFTGPDGVRRKKTTKVPIAGGMFQGEKLTRNQAKSRALIIAHQMAEAQSLEYAEKDNRSTREIFELMMNGKLGRVSTATYNNAQTSYKHFLKWLGKRADAPMRLITKVDIKEWVIHRRNEVRAATCRKDLSAIRAAFAWAEDAEIITRTPCNNASTTTSPTLPKNPSIKFANRNSSFVLRTSYFVNHLSSFAQPERIGTQSNSARKKSATFTRLSLSLTCSTRISCPCPNRSNKSRTTSAETSSHLAIVPTLANS